MARGRVYLAGAYSGWDMGYMCPFYGLVYLRTFYTDLNSLWLLAEWHEVKGV